MMTSNNNKEPYQQAAIVGYKGDPSRQRPPSQQLICQERVVTIDDPDSAEGRVLVAHCREELDRYSCCSLPDFLTEYALSAMARESREVARHAFRSHTSANVYFSEDDPAHPRDHPKRMFFDRSTM